MSDTKLLFEYRRLTNLRDSLRQIWRIALIFSVLSLSLFGCGSGSSVQNKFSVTLGPQGSFSVNGQTNVSRAPSIELVFNQPVLRSTLNSNNIILFPTNNPENLLTVTGISEIGSTGKIFFFCNASTVLDPNTSYTLQVSTNVMSINQGRLSDSRSFTFTTGSEIIPVAVIAIPVDGQTGVSRTPIIQVKFSEPVQNVNNSSVRLEEQNGTAADIKSISASQHYIAFSITTESLKPYTKYNLWLTSGITDNLGNPIKFTKFTFTTGGDTFPEGGLVIPCLGQLGLSITPLIELQFSAPVVNVNRSTILIIDETGLSVPIANIFSSADGKNYFVIVNQTLLPNLYYSVSISPEIKDNAGNPLQVLQQQYFFTGISSEPVIKFTDPYSIINVSLMQEFSFISSQPLYNLNHSNLTLTNLTTSSSVALDGITHHGIEPNSFSVAPLAPLLPENYYVLRLESSITTTNNMPIESTYFYFTTRAILVR